MLLGNYFCFADCCNARYVVAIFLVIVALRLTFGGITLKESLAVLLSLSTEEKLICVCLAFDAAPSVVLLRSSEVSIAVFMWD